MNMKMLFEHAAQVGASDLLITAGSPPIVRIDGDLRRVTNQLLKPDQTHALVWSLLNETQQEQFERKRELDFSLAVTGSLRFRANVYYQKGAVSAAFRLIPRSVPNMTRLGLPPIMGNLTLRTHGLILLTGPTGSGKSTTCASMVDLINETRRCHIVTVEDPIEFVHENKMSIVDQREVYADTLSFANALKYVLRQDPDVILVGEMRDVETISAALTAAETGHLVIATLHTNDAIQAIDRIVDVFPPHQQNQVRTQLAFSLIAVVAQQLIPHADGKGRIMAAELLIKSHAVATHIREGKTHQTRSIMESSRAEGNITMDQRLKELYEGGQISWEELFRRVTSPTFLHQVKRRTSPPPKPVPTAEEAELVELEEVTDDEPPVDRSQPSKLPYLRRMKKEK
ncbi:type IV pilus twitching motility protein PilT [Planctomycetales bacterium ZRK34]|nr:type IV pilus twitching motility protein PilT [Planctomycetales bacterium ZRK34]